MQAQFKAAFGDERAQLVGTAFGLAVDDQFEAGQQATSPDVAHDLVPVRDPFKTIPEDAAKLEGALVEPVTLQHVDDGGADSGRQRVRDVVVKNKNPRSCAAFSISALVSTAASGRPAPSVLDRVRM